MSDETPRPDAEDTRPQGPVQDDGPAVGDRTERLQPDGTIGAGRPTAPDSVTRPPAPGWGGQAPRPVAVVPPGQPLPLNPRRRVNDDPPTGEAPAVETPEPGETPADETPAAVEDATAEDTVAAQAPQDVADEAPTGKLPTVRDDVPPPAAAAPPVPPAAPPVDDRAVDEAADEPADAADDPSDLEQTAVVPVAVVPADLFDEQPTEHQPTAEQQPADEPDAPETAALPPVDDTWTADETRVDDLPHDDRAEPMAAPAADTHATPTVSATEQPTRSRWRRPAVLVPAGLLLVLGIAYGADLLVAGDDVPRNTVVAGVDIGGLSPSAAATALSDQLAPRVTADHVLVADDVQGVLSPATAGITLDVDGTVQAASGQPLNPWTRLVSLFGEREVEPVITGDETALTAQLDAFAETVDRAPADAGITVEGTTATVVPPVTGRQLDRAAAADAVTEALASGGDPETPIELPVDTVDVQVDEAAAQQALDDVVTPALAAPVTVTGDDGTTAELDPEGIAGALVFAAGDGGALDVSLDPGALQTALGDQLGDFGSPAEDARFEVTGDSIAVVPSVDGTGVDPNALAASLLPVLQQPAPREVTASLGAVPADFTTDEANALGIVEQVSSFTTNFTSGASGTNIRVVAEFVDGAVVLPGETFSLNGYTGPRGEAEGYVPAGVINNGEFTQAVGGGISQFATTMFNAVFFAGLEDVYHKPHSYYISRYPAGREATVYYDSIDLQWRNDSPTGIYVQTEWVAGGSITVTFWGTERYEIESVSSDRYNVRTPVVQEKPDDGSCNPQGGANGFDITVTRIFEDPVSGAQISTEDFQTRYAAEPVIRCVPVEAPAPSGTAPGAPAQPTGRRPSRVGRPWRAA
jgi:vancomycin resistance protein YoaR